VHPRFVLSHRRSQSQDACHGAEGKGSYFRRVPPEFQELFAAMHLPDANRLIVAGCGKMGAIRTERGACQRARVPFDIKGLLAGLSIP